MLVLSFFFFLSFCIQLMRCKHYCEAYMTVYTWFVNVEKKKTESSTFSRQRLLQIKVLSLLYVASSVGRCQKGREHKKLKTKRLGTSMSYQNSSFSLFFSPFFSWVCRCDCSAKTENVSCLQKTGLHFFWVEFCYKAMPYFFG